jgi:hypothetical protein
MTKQNQNDLIGWLRQNWVLIVFLGTLIAAWSSLNYRVDAMEEKIATYPSQDYFDLRFQTIEKDLANLGKVLGDHTNK